MRSFSQTPDGAFLAYNATVTGDIRLGADSSVWFGAVVRGDVALVSIGDRVNIQDGAVVHCDTGFANAIAVVTPRFTIPDRHLVAGVPGKDIRPFNEKVLDQGMSKM
jgi:carbonic anhydrase/acetyltransferase-like protein (isoleucine patch superfamily)